MTHEPTQDAVNLASHLARREMAVVLTVHEGFELVAYDVRDDVPRLLAGVPLQAHTPELVEDALDVVLDAVRVQLRAQLSGGS